MKLLLTYEGTDAEQLSKVTWQWAKNEEIPNKDAEWILDMIRSGEIWSQMDGIPDNWRILPSDASDAEYARSNQLLRITAYELDDDDDYDHEKPLARSERYAIDFKGNPESSAAVSAYVDALDEGTDEATAWEKAQEALEK